MNLAQLRTFQAVAELRHFAKAADRCALSQPAVSHQISQLEQDIGARLFNRTGRRVSLTVVGEVLLEEARRVLSTVDRAEERVREAARGAIGRIRFGASPTAALYVLNAQLLEYGRKYPLYEFRLDLALESDLLDRVARNDLDMAVLAGELPTAELRATPLVEDQLVAVCSPALPESPWGRRVDDRFVREVTWILREQGSDTRRRIERWFERQKVTPRRTLTVTGPDAVKRAAEAGLGVGVLSARCVHDDVRAGRLKRVRLAAALPRRVYCVIDHPQKHHGAACRAMLAELESFAAGATK